MFRLYLECGSVGALAEELARQRILSKVRTFAGGRVKGGGPYSVGALAHFLKNRFCIGEVVYQGETHAGEHASIIDRPTFEAVQAKLAENARARQMRVESSPAILMGRIFDDRGNRMTPSHSNKDRVRYRYYVCHVLLQRREKDAGRVTRVPAIQLEKLVVEAIRAKARPDAEPRGFACYRFQSRMGTIAEIFPVASVHCQGRQGFDRDVAEDLFRRRRARLRRPRAGMSDFNRRATLT